MVIKLEPQKEERLEEIAKATGQSVAEVIESAIDRVIREQESKPEPQRTTDEDHDLIMADIDYIRGLAASEIPDDGFSGRDHDRVIYRKDW